MMPKSDGDKAFVDLHKTTVTDPLDDKAAKGNDKWFRGATKPFDRSANRMGYNPGEDVDAYDPQAKEDDAAVYNDDEWKPSLAKEDVGPILELSKKVLGNYIKTAASHVQSDSFMWGVGMRDPKVDIVQHNKNVSKRRKGIQMAANKLTKEDVEEIDEGHGMFSARTFGWNNQSENDDKKYKIIRFHKKGGSKTIAKGVSLSYAKSHCGHSETSSSTCTGKSPKAYTRRHGEWFDGYDVDKRRR
jgi:hypothetical protein